MSSWFEVGGRSDRSKVTAEKALALEIEREERGEHRGIGMPETETKDRSTSCRQVWHAAPRKRALLMVMVILEKEMRILSSSNNSGPKVDLLVISR